MPHFTPFARVPRHAWFDIPTAGRRRTVFSGLQHSAFSPLGSQLRDEIKYLVLVWHEVYSLIGQGLTVIWYGQ
jgi:hypothetical protein